MKKRLIREDILSTLQRELPFLRRRYGATRLALYGSFARGTATERSDVDLLVELSRPLGVESVALSYYLERRLGRKVGLSTFETLRRSLGHPRYRQAALNVQSTPVDYDISLFSAQVQVILRALKKYGMILADNGAAWYVSGAPDERWNNDVLHELHRVTGSAFEAVDTTSLMVHPDSAQVASRANIPLVPGWNLVSLPVAAGSTAVTLTLSSIAGAYDQVTTYSAVDPEDPWKSFRPGGPPYASDLLYVSEQMGLWIRATSRVTLTVAGGAVYALTIALKLGWNLVGYPSSVSRPVTDALACIGGKYDLVYTYAASDSADVWKCYQPGAPPPASDLAALEPGRGYWIRATQDCLWVVPPP